jgi:hypothetical protein
VDDGPVSTAGSALRQQLDDALARESQRAGTQLRWDELEAHHVASAVRAADNRARLQRLLAAELRRGDDVRPSTVARLSSEIRLLDVAIGHHLRELHVEGLVAKSGQHARAARARWGDTPRGRGIA